MKIGQIKDIQFVSVSESEFDDSKAISRLESGSLNGSFSFEGEIKPCNKIKYWMEKFHGSKCKKGHSYREYMFNSHSVWKCKNCNKEL